MTHRAAHGEVNVRKNKRGCDPGDAAVRAGPALPPHPISPHPFFGSACLGQTAGWQQARSSVPRIRSRQECLVRSTFTWIPLPQARFASCRPSLMDFFFTWPLQPADLSPEQVKCCRASVCGCPALTQLGEPWMMSARSSWDG